jgi:anaerobic magnesium-protoporphyrin IX monomethyl ester cyclase
VDDILTMKKSRIMRLCAILSSMNLPITWEGDTRADFTDEELLRSMARAGCVRMNFGIESGAPEILEGLKKKLDLSRVVEAFRLAKKAGIETRGTAMIGNPGDDRKTIQKTIKFLKKLPYLDQPYLSIAQPYPGTELRNIALKGSSNLRVTEDRLDEMRRYGSAVMKVGDISPDEMITIQRKALWSIYLTPRRIVYNLFRAGFRDGLLMALSLARTTFLRVFFRK